MAGSWNVRAKITHAAVKRTFCGLYSGNTLGAVLYQAFVAALNSFMICMLDEQPRRVAPASISCRANS